MTAHDTAAEAEPAAFGTISIGALAAALGSSRSTVLRAVTNGAIPDAEARTRKGHRRWKIETARNIVRKAGRPVPPAWGSP
jgi:hypothetical protein